MGYEIKLCWYSPNLDRRIHILISDLVIFPFCIMSLTVEMYIFSLNLARIGEVRPIGP